MTKKLIELIEKANIYDSVYKTQIDKLNKLSAKYENNILIKREDLQDVRSFKIRGALNKINSLKEEEKQKGIIAASAGNHAQGVAFSAQKCKIKATIVMPITTPQIKIDSVKSYGAHVMLHGDSYDDAHIHAKKIANKEDLTFIHPFDDLEVIAGQGTIAAEIINQIHDIDYIFIAVGGGGLIAGISSYIKSINPKVKIIAVEPENSNCFEQAIKHNKPIEINDVGIFADGVAVKKIGNLTFELSKKNVDDCILVSTDEICASIKDIYDDIRAIAEPAGALSTAGIKKYIYKNNIKNKTFVSILCGANINFHRLRHISERAQIGEKKEILLSISIREKKGTFLELCNHLSKFSITECNYRFSDSENANVFVGLEISSSNQRESIIKSLSKNFSNVIDLTDNELAKLHLRYMIGGKSEKKEYLYRFQFPEKPGALLNFLTSLGSNFNITLFHYRNHGSAFGRVLVGIEKEETKKLEFQSFLDQIGYKNYNESDNLATDLFL